MGGSKTSGRGSYGDPPWKSIPCKHGRERLSAYGGAARPTDHRHAQPGAGPQARTAAVAPAPRWTPRQPQASPARRRAAPAPAPPWRPPQDPRSGGSPTAPPWTGADASIAGRSSSRYRPGLDGLRALAIVAVLLYHAGAPWMRGGFLGVDLFFVLSGFLITSLLIAELDGSGRISLEAFYRRRARRLLPALGVVLLVTTAGLALFWREEMARFGGDLMASLGYVANWWFIFKHQSYFQATGRPSPFQHLWSLAVEEQFYLVWPVVVAAVLRFRASVASLLNLWALAIAGAVGSTLWMAIIAVQHKVPYGADASRVYFGTDTHAMGVLLGAGAAALVAVVERRGMGERARGDSFSALDIAGGGALIAACGAMMLTSEFSPALYRGGFLAFAAVAAVAVVAVSRPRSLLGEALGSEPLHWIGTRSYGLYLWHWPIFVLTRPQLDVPYTGGADVLLRLALTAAAAEASYRLVERPIRARGLRAWGEQILELVRGGVAVPGRVRAAAALGTALVLLAAAGMLIAAGLTGRKAPVALTRATATAGSHPVSATAAPKPAPPPAAPAGPTAPGTLSLTAIGDSVMLGAAADIQRALPGVVVDAVEGRQASEAFGTIDHLLSTGHLGRNVVLQTGTNGTIDPAELRALLARLKDHRVIILNVHVPRPWQDQDNAVLAAAARASGRVELVDWNRLASTHPQWFYDDGIHLRSAGAEQYTSLVVSALR